MIFWESDGSKFWKMSWSSNESQPDEIKLSSNEIANYNDLAAELAAALHLIKSLYRSVQS